MQPGFGLETYARGTMDLAQCRICSRSMDVRELCGEKKRMQTVVVEVALRFPSL